MRNDLNDEKIVLEIRELIAGIDSAKNEINIYAELMKLMLISNISNN